MGRKDKISDLRVEISEFRFIRKKEKISDSRFWEIRYLNKNL